MERRDFLKLPLAAAAVSGALFASKALPAQAAPAAVRMPTATTPVVALKGFGHSGSSTLALQQIKSLNLKWHYSWGSRANVFTPPFVPMIRNAAVLDQDALGIISRQLASTQTKHLLGFNEPDLSSQANMSVDKAISLWPKLQSTGLRLGSPACISPSSLWLADFMAKAKNKGLRVDFITMHIYAWPNATDFLDKLTKLHEKYQKPIWVTEYAVADWNATATNPCRYSRAETEAFMRATVAGMRQMPFIERFAWKSRPAGDIKMACSTFWKSDGTPTSTAKLYASL